MAKRGGYVNYKNLNRLVANSKEFKQATQKEITSIYKPAKQMLIESVDSHPVSKELMAGATNPESTPNSSGTLNGIGNLYSFIGFPRGYNPIGIINQKLAEINLVNLNKTKVLKKGQVAAYFRVDMPSLEEIYGVTPLPWSGTDSWARQIETGISGLSSYLHKKSKKSRSGFGVQANNLIRNQSFNPKAYLSPIFAMFYKQFNIKEMKL